MEKIEINKEYQYSKEEFDNAIGTAKSFMSNYEQLQFPIIDEHRLEYWNSEGYYMALRSDHYPTKYQIAEASLKGGQSSRNSRKKFMLEMDEDKRIAFMQIAVRSKFAANTYLAKKLMDTGDVQIIEKNYWNDTLFGVDDKTLRGANCLGKILMHVREELKTNPKLM